MWDIRTGEIIEAPNTAPGVYTKPEPVLNKLEKSEKPHCLTYEEPPVRFTKTYVENVMPGISIDAPYSKVEERLVVEMGAEIKGLERIAKLYGKIKNGEV